MLYFHINIQQGCRPAKAFDGGVNKADNELKLPNDRADLPITTKALIPNTPTTTPSLTPAPETASPPPTTTPKLRLYIKTDYKNNPKDAKRLEQAIKQVEDGLQGSTFGFSSLCRNVGKKFNIPYISLRDNFLR